MEDVGLLNTSTIALDVEITNENEAAGYLIGLMIKDGTTIETKAHVTMELINGIAVFRLDDQRSSNLAALSVKEGIVIDGQLITVFFMFSKQLGLDELASFLEANEFNGDLIKAKLAELKHQETVSLFTKINIAISQIMPFFMVSGLLISIIILILEHQIFGINNLSGNLFINKFFILGDAVANIIVILLAGFIGYQIAGKYGFSAGISCGLATQIDRIYLKTAANSGLIGGIIAGILGGYSVVLVQELCKKMPTRLKFVKKMIIYPFVTMGLIGMLTYLCNYDIAYLNEFLATIIRESPLVIKLLGGLILGLLMTFKPGNTFSKIAYIFGLSQIIENNYSVMAAITASSMASILAIALAATIFKNKFTKKEREMSRSNYLNGLLYDATQIQPLYHQEDARLVRKACIIAGMIAGGLAMIYNCDLKMPYGGIFAVPLMIRPLRYLIAILSGSICGGFIYGFFKENGEE